MSSHSGCCPLEWVSDIEGVRYRGCPLEAGVTLLSSKHEHDMLEGDGYCGFAGY